MSMQNATKALGAVTDALKGPSTIPPLPTPLPPAVPNGKPTASPPDRAAVTAKPSEPKKQDLLATLKPFVIPIIGLVVGAVIMQMFKTGSGRTVGTLVLYFGAQSFMNIFMSWVLGTHVSVPQGTEVNGDVLQQDLKGCPAGFALTALQQVVSFIIFIFIYIGSIGMGRKMEVKQLSTATEWVSVIIFGCVFALNIALNNFSLGYISIGVNLIIRSCLPLFTFVSQQIMSQFNLYRKQQCDPVEIILMSIGVICATLFTWADFEGKIEMGGRFIGVIACLGSVLCGSLNLALAGVLGDLKLGLMDTVAYMAVPATVFLAPIIFFASKPVPGEWKIFAPEAPHSMTDWEILKVTWEYSRETICWLFLSGLLSFLYNLCQFNIVHQLSPSATAFGGNFNKAALTFMTLLLPFLQTKDNPPMPYIGLEWGALFCNIAAFSMYSHLQIQKKQKEKAGQPQTKSLVEDEESGSGSSDASSSGEE